MASASDLASLLNIYVMPAGRRLHALRKTHAVAQQKVSSPDLHSFISVAMDKNMGALEGRTRWGEAKNEKIAYPEGAMLLNHEHDQIYASVHNVAGGMAEGMPAGTPLAEAGAMILATVYADGLAALTQKDYVQQREVTNVWLSRMNSDLAEFIDVLGVRPMIDRLAVVNDEMGAIIDEVKTRAPVTWDDIKAADAAGQLAMLQVVAEIIGRFSGRKPGDDEMRAKLLAPILEQNDKVGELYRRRSKVTDVDPESGEENDPPIPW
ncbi:MAG: hypothetical protein ACOC1F_08860 [Myxococcota bacterium]